MRWVFHATAGFLGRVDSQTQCGFWAEEPADHGFDPGRLITVDLARTPTAAAAKQIGFREVEVDDCFTGPNGVVSGTTLGPAWPELRMAGVVYLEHGFTASLPAAKRPACPGRSDQPTASPVTMWIDLASPEHCDAGSDSLTTIGTGDAPSTAPCS